MNIQKAIHQARVKYINDAFIDKLRRCYMRNNNLLNTTRVKAFLIKYNNLK